MDVRQTKEYGRYLRKSGWQIEKYDEEKAFVFVRKIPLTLFSVIKLQRPETPIPGEWVEKIGKKNKALIINVEPKTIKEVSRWRQWGYRMGKKPFLPSKTYEIDLTIKQQQLLDKMRKSARYNIKSGGKKGVDIKVRDGKQLVEEKQLMEEIIGLSKKSLLINLVKSFGERCYAVVADVDNRVVGFSFYLTSPDQAEQFISGSNKLGKKMKAPTLCAWNGILEAKRRKLKTMDLGGVYDRRFPIKAWRGFSEFKRGFGGEIKEYPGLMYKWRWPI